MEILEVLAEERLGNGVLRKHRGLRQRLLDFERGLRRPLSAAEGKAERKRVLSIAQLLSEYQQEKDAEECENILRTLDEIVRDRPVAVGKETIDDFEASLLSSDERFRKATEKRSLRNQEFLEVYSWLKARAGLRTQAEVARKAGLSRSYVTVIESGAHRPQQKTLQKLARAFGVSVAAFVPAVRRSRRKRGSVRR